MDTASYITIITALIAAIAAIVSPIIVQLISQKASYKEKTAQCFFDQKISAYTKFIAAANAFEYDHSNDSFAKVLSLCAQAELFCSSLTSEKLTVYTYELMRYTTPEAPCVNAKELTGASIAAISAMRDELKVYEAK